MLKAGRKATLIIEYAMVVGIVAAALALMQVYMRRGIQGVIKTSADQLNVSVEEYLNAKTAEEFSTHKKPVMNVNAQWLGAWERGLFHYHKLSGASTDPVVTTSSSVTDITLTESPPAGASPIRIRTINQNEERVNSGVHSIVAPQQIN